MNTGLIMQACGDCLGEQKKATRSMNSTYGEALFAGWGVCAGRATTRD